MWQCLCSIENDEHVMNCVGCHRHRDYVAWVRQEQERRTSIQPAPPADSSDVPFKFTGDGREYSDIPFKFTGDSREYFKIWVANIFLTIVTLGIYSAWAKVRKNRYFYRNTFLQESSFDYLADPVRILKGRLIAVALAGGLYAAFQFQLTLGLILMVPAIVLLPWLIVKALTFRARNTSYRNIRFDFSGTYGEAMGVFIGRRILTYLTFGLCYPYEPYRRNQFVINNSAYGTTPFAFSGEVGGFYRIYFGQAFGLGILVGILTYMTLTVTQGLLPASAYQVFSRLVSLMAGLTIIAFVRAASTNYVWSNVRLGDYQFRSTLSRTKMIWIYLSNAIAILFSVGLLIPWAAIRMARYRFENLSVCASGEMELFIAGEQEKVASVGEEVLDYFDFDLGV